MNNIFNFLLAAFTAFTLTLAGCGGAGGESALLFDDPMPDPYPRLSVTFEQFDPMCYFYNSASNVDMSGKSIVQSLNKNGALNLRINEFSNLGSQSSSAYCLFYAKLDTSKWRYLCIDVGAMSPGMSVDMFNENPWVVYFFRMNASGTLYVMDMQNITEGAHSGRAPETKYFTAERVILALYVEFKGNVGDSITIKKIYQTNDAAGAEPAEGI